MERDHEGKRILVCGASRGLGAGIAEALACHGARVAVAARPSHRLMDTATRVNAVAIPADLSDPRAPARVVEQVYAELGGLDGLVVNSGGPPSGAFRSLSDEAWSQAIDGVLMMAIRVIREAIPQLTKSDSGAILIVLSSSVREPIPNLVTSNVLRPALSGLIKTLVDEIAPIRINGLAPGRISTERVAALDEERATLNSQTLDEVRSATRARIPLGRYGEPHEVAEVASFLLSPRASYMSGATVHVDGGLVRSLP